MNWSSVRAALSGVVFGILAGATVGFLTAPDSGAHTRKMIKRNVGRSRKRVTTAVYDAGSQVTGTIHDARKQAASIVKDTVQQVQSRASKVGLAGRQTIEKEVQTAKGGITKAIKSIAS
jgi:gas vesicle protein